MINYEVIERFIYNENKCIFGDDIWLEKIKLRIRKVLITI